MILEIKKRVESELKSFILDIDKTYRLSSISPLLYENIKEFMSRDGKRVRPFLFVIGYLGFAKKAAPRLYRSAVSLELLHDFMLVHDDIIDKSETRRGRPSMHANFNNYLAGYKNAKFSGQDLAIVAADVMYALALEAFLSAKEDKLNKERALRRLIRAAIFTGSGEFIELLLGIKSIDEITKQDIYKIYDLKTANYTFSSPLSIGAALAGAKIEQINKIFNYGTYLGRAFQIKDDILGLFGQEAETGKSTLTDLKEAKKTILVWQAYNYSTKSGKAVIKNILSKKNSGRSDLLKMQNIVSGSGSLDYAKIEINRLIKKASCVIQTTKMNHACIDCLNSYSKELLRV